MTRLEVPTYRSGDEAALVTLRFNVEDAVAVEQLGADQVGFVVDEDIEASALASSTWRTP